MNASDPRDTIDEVTDEMLANARPFKALLPDLFEAWTRMQRRQPVEPSHPPTCVPR